MAFNRKFKAVSLGDGETDDAAAGSGEDEGGSLSFSYDWDVVRHHSVGDVIMIGGEYVKIVKKTNYNIAVVPYQWYHAVYDSFRRVIGRN